MRFSLFLAGTLSLFLSLGCMAQVPADSLPANPVTVAVVPVSSASAAVSRSVPQSGCISMVERCSCVSGDRVVSAPREQCGSARSSLSLASVLPDVQSAGEHWGGIPVDRRRSAPVREPQRLGRFWVE